MRSLKLLSALVFIFTPLFEGEARQTIGYPQPIKDAISAYYATPPNYPKAYSIYKTEAEKGNKEAQYFLANMCAEGKGLAKKDFQCAIKWYEKAGDQGHTGAQMKLANMFYSGTEGVAKDLIKSFMWAWLAALEGGSHEAANLLHDIKNLLSNNMEEYEKALQTAAKKRRSFQNRYKDRKVF